MRKNKMLRMASALLMLVLLTTSVVGGTFAKYVTTSTATETARVAKWGVTFTTGSDLFAAAYVDTAVTDDTATVKTIVANTKLVAPGTKGTGFGIKKTSANAPEVSYQMTIKLDASAKVPTLKYTPTGSTATDYNPVKFSVYNGTTEIKANLSLSELTTLFDGQHIIYTYDVGARKYYVDKDLDGMISETEKANSEVDAPDIKIKWEWAYEDATNKSLYDELDTILGNKAASNSTAIDSYSNGTISDINTEVSLPWTMTATQID